MPFYRQAIDTGSDLYSLISIITRLAINNLLFTEEIAKTLIQGINQLSAYKSALSYITVTNILYTGHTRLLRY
jgi:hypothetical protein